MKKLPPVALVCAGNLTDSPIARFRGLSERLGPLKSSSLRLASRFANTLRAGYPVDSYGEFQVCRLLLVSVPDRAVADTVSELSRTGLDWRGKHIILCSARLESEELAPLAELGAQTASISAIPAFDDRLFLAEGDRAAIKLARPLVEAGGSKIVSLPPAHKKFYLAASACTGPLLTLILACAAECLKLAGVAGPDAAAILQAQAEKSTRAFLNGGRKAYQDLSDLPGYASALHDGNPALAEFFQQTVKLSSRLGKQSIT